VLRRRRQVQVSGPGSVNVQVGGIGILCEFWCGGTMLAEPLPNINTACLYILKIPAQAPALEIITVNRRQA
jgi:hypothetical protein